MAWDEETIQKVWEKGKIVPDQKADQWRKDECGAWIGRQNYGKRDSSYGWEIDHISPGGPDILSNLRPLQWENNAEKSEGRLKCNVTASGTKNVRKA